MLPFAAGKCSENVQFICIKLINERQSSKGREGKGKPKKGLKSGKFIKFAASVLEIPMKFHSGASLLLLLPPLLIKSAVPAN